MLGSFIADYQRRGAMPIQFVWRRSCFLLAVSVKRASSTGVRLGEKRAVGHRTVPSVVLPVHATGFHKPLWVLQATPAAFTGLDPAESRCE